MSKFSETLDPNSLLAMVGFSIGIQRGNDQWGSEEWVSKSQTSPAMPGRGMGSWDRKMSEVIPG